MIYLIEEVNGELNLAADRVANPNLSRELFEWVSNRSNEWQVVLQIRTEIAYQVEVEASSERA